MQQSFRIQTEYCHVLKIPKLLPSDFSKPKSKVRKAVTQRRLIPRKTCLCSESAPHESCKNGTKSFKRFKSHVSILQSQFLFYTTKGWTDYNKALTVWPVTTQAFTAGNITSRYCIQRQTRFPIVFHTNHASKVTIL